MNMKSKRHATILAGAMALVLTLAPGWVTADEDPHVSPEADSR
jgi:hypothetical protein